MSEDIVDTHEQAAALPRPPLIVRAGLTTVVPGSGPLTLERLGAGHSNLTFTIGRDGRRYVLRRPPRPPIPPRAHDVAREFRMLAALEGQSVRVPATVVLCEDASRIGAPFYLMELVDGIVIRDRLPAAVDDVAGRRHIAEELVDALVELHAVDWERAPALRAFGDGQGYLERQVSLWGQQWDRNRTRPIAAIDEAQRILERHRPTTGSATVVHGDYKLDNVLFAPERPPRLTAILDWEMATIGDPLADLGYLLATWREPDDPDDDVLDFSPVTRSEGFLDRAGLAARYATRSGRDVGDVWWYEGMALWKLAIILEGLYRRHVAGASDDAFLERLDAGVPRLADHVLERLQAAAGSR